MQNSARSSVLQKIQNLFTSAPYVQLKQISVMRTPVNGCFQIRIFYCVLVNFSEKYSILTVIYLFTRNTSTAWCKSGTRTPGPGTLGPGTWDSEPPSKFKSGTPGPLQNLKVGPPHLCLMNSFFSEYFIAFFTYLFLCLF